MDQLPLPKDLRQRTLAGINGLRMHIIEAGFESPDRPALLLLHGFPELAYSWRKVMPALAAAGYHVIAPDQRGYGRTTGWDSAYDADITPFRLTNLVRDQVTLLAALGLTSVAGVIGHDFGASVAAWCAIIRPDLFRTVTLMSAPFSGAPSLPASPADDPIHAALAALPRPRKHYQWYYSTREANADLHHPPQGLHDFLRAYYHHKSADWSGNTPYELAAWSAPELAKLPTYYIMDLDRRMSQSVEMPATPSPWLSDPELGVYVSEYARTGFQGGLNWYRCRTEGHNGDLELFAGRTIDIPACFISGASDWGIFQVPGALARMQNTACTDMRACHLLEGAGHWVQQEQPSKVTDALLEFLSR